jgi:hypothetical protein
MTDRPDYERLRPILTWLDDELGRIEHRYKIEHAAVSRLRIDLLASRTLRSLVEAPSPGPYRAWLCFIALVDIYVDPIMPGLPLPGVHPPRFTVSRGWVFNSIFWGEPCVHPFVRATTPAGRARMKVIERLEALSAEFKSEGEKLMAEIKLDEDALHAACWKGSPVSTWRDDAEMDWANFQEERYALSLRRDEVRALARAAAAINEVRAAGPRVYHAESGDLREGAGALIAMLDFTLRTDGTMSKPEREGLIAKVLGDFFPGALEKSTQAPKEYVRTTLKEARRRAAVAARRVAASRNEPQGAIPTYAGGLLYSAGVIGPWTEQEVAASPNGRGIRLVLDVPPKDPGEIEPTTPLT